ncbi:MAG TPA: hydrolase, partial [Dehalococcoidia bacterium]|nr:hydrolase [Dehalococcoidia bacterium]
MRRIRPGSFIGIQELRPHVSYNSFWNFDGFQETGFIHIDQHWEWRAGHEAHTGMNITREGVVTAFEISDGVFVPPGTYDHNEAQIVFFTNEGAPLTGRIETTIGGFFGGDRVRISPSVRLRIGDSFNTEVGLDRNDIDLPGGAFVTNLARARVSYSFTPRIFTQALVQYNDNADIWSANLRFGWLQAANTGLFVVYNDTRGLVSSTDPHVGGQSLIVKFSRLFDLAN